MENINFGFVWYSPDHNELVGVDDGSGGYAFMTENLCSARIFNTKENAEEYRDIWTRSGTDGYGYKAINWVLINLKNHGKER
jgi:hypothetical protein